MTMKRSFPLLALAATVVAEVDGSGDSPPSRWANIRRRLSYEKIAGYGPSSLVTDHCAIDRDQAAIESQLALRTPQSFAHARKIYEEGGNSESYARITLDFSKGLLEDLPAEGVEIWGKNEEGEPVEVRAYKDYERGDRIIEVRYETSIDQSNYVGCQVGALVETNTERCLAEKGDLEIDGVLYPYHYNPAEDNRNGRTIAGFSKGIKPRDIIHSKPDFRYFFNYYGTADYAHQFIEAAFIGKSTQFTKENKGTLKFTNGNADFSRSSLVGREQFIKRTTESMSIFMFIIRQWEEALDDCERNCINCNKGSSNSWDEGVCFYTGSFEGEDGAADGKLMRQLADDMCRAYRTCGVEGTDPRGTAKLNYDLFGLFSLGNFEILTGNCFAARGTTREIISRMYVPLIQGAILRAHEVDRRRGGEEERAEGAAFAAAVLPRVHAASPEAARVIYENMKVGAPSTDSEAVKAALESVYEDIGVSCRHVGGLWDEANGEYHEGMGPCCDAVDKPYEDHFLAIVLGSTFGTLFVVAAAMVFYMRRREKAGKPVFNPLTRHMSPNEMSAEILELFQRKETDDTLHSMSGGSKCGCRTP